MTTFSSIFAISSHVKTLIDRQGGGLWIIPGCVHMCTDPADHGSPRQEHQLCAASTTV